MKKQALTKEGKELLPHLSEFNNFYLAGGTALALQIGHRVSVDFDFFSKKEIEQNFIEEVEDVFSDWKVNPSVNTKDELTVFVNNVKVTFLKYPFPIVLPLEDVGDLKLLSVKEIAATKAYTLGRRVTYKDYVDLYFLIKESHINIKEIIDLAEKKYKDEFNSRLFLEQLISIDDVSEVDIDFLGEKVKKEEIKSFLEERVEEFKL